MANCPDFDIAFREQFGELLRWRRDVRRFLPDSVPSALLETVLASVAHAPSVGNSQPWRFVRVDSSARRQGLLNSFRRANDDALAGYRGERAAHYARLKLSGLAEAPIVLAVFTDEATNQGHGLGRQTMPETLSYSTVAAVNTLWLVARCHGLGVGWVSIIEPDSVRTLLEVPSAWSLTALLCLGWPVEDHVDPELERAGWQERSRSLPVLIHR